MRTLQTFRCTRCGHSVTHEVKYPKYGWVPVSLVDMAAQLRCSRCGVKAGEIHQDGKLFRYDGQISQVVHPPRAGVSVPR